MASRTQRIAAHAAIAAIGALIVGTTTSQEARAIAAVATAMAMTSVLIDNPRGLPWD